MTPHLCLSGTSSDDGLSPRWLEPSNHSARVLAVLEAARAFRKTLTTSSLTQTAAARHPADRFDAAIDAYESGSWEAAYSMAARLADGGHPAAAHLALLMLRYGAPLYRLPLQAEPIRIARWAGLVLQAKTAEKLRQRDAARATSRRTAAPRSITAIA